MIKKYRIKKGYTQEILSELLNINTRYLQKLEKEKNYPSIELLRKMAIILEITDSDLAKYIKGAKEND